jgi:hypothetical protein
VKIFGDLHHPRLSVGHLDHFAVDFIPAKPMRRRVLA